MKLSVVIPCFNESDNVHKLHDELLPVISGLVSSHRKDEIKTFSTVEMIFVDDGSRDDTFSQLQAYFQNENKAWLTCKFLKHSVNRGLGAAIRTGFSNVDGDIVVTVDSDGTYKFSEIPALLSYLKPGIDIVTASPYHPQGGILGVPANRLFLSRGSSFLYRILVNWNIYTYTCLFRAYRSEVIKSVFFKSDGFLAGTEILVNAILKGYGVAELPAVLSRRMYGVSKAKILETILAHLNFQRQLLLKRFHWRITAESKQINESHV